jgi:hypothetical protein
MLVCLSSISDLCMISTLEHRTNSYVAPYVVVLLEMSQCVSHYRYHYLYPYPYV